MNASEIGLQINSEKTKIMAFAQTNTVNICTTLNSQITLVDNFKYLGSGLAAHLRILNSVKHFPGNRDTK